jgi:hypothetical protein
VSRAEVEQFSGTTYIVLGRAALVIVVAYLLVSLFLDPSTGRAAPTFTVNSTADVVASPPLDSGPCETATGNGVCTLRAAIMKANHYPGGGVTINLPGLPPGAAYHLTIPPGGPDDETNGDLNVTAPLTITGGGYSSTIVDASDIQDRVVRASSDATISGVMIRGGNVGNGLGGGVYDGANLTLNDVSVSANSAAAGAGVYVGNSATLKLDYSLVSGNVASGSGGGIGADDAGIPGAGGITVDHTTLDGNMASAWGGAIDDGAASQLTITNSTISNNTSGNIAGGIRSFHLLMLNSTVSGNSAVTDGGGIAGDGSLYNVTVTANRADSNSDGNGHGGGVYAVNAYSGLQFQNSIIGGNFETHFYCHGLPPQCGQAPFLGDCSGTLTSLTNNILTYANTSYCTVTGSAPVFADPGLGPLQDNGGPTKTHALLAGSPAIDGGDPGGCTDSFGATLKADQRGYSRPVDGGSGHAYCDIGAFEYLGVSPQTPTPTASPTPTATPVFTPTPTASVVPTGTSTPSPSTTGSATPTPTTTTTETPTPSPSSTLPAGRIQGDVNCDGHIDLADFELILRFAAGLNEGITPGSCPDLGQPGTGGAAAYEWGDLNCDRVVSAADALFVLAFTSGIKLRPIAPSCTAIGDSLD